MSSPQLDKLELEIGKLTLAVKEQSLNSSSDNKKQPWWIVLTQLLAIPAILIVIFLNYSQSTHEPYAIEKTIAETKKIKVEELKAKAEIEKIMIELSEKKATSQKDYKEQINLALPQLIETVNKLEKVNESTTSVLNEKLFHTFLLLWVVYHALSLIFNIIEYVWNTAINLLSTSVYKFTDQGSKFRRKLVSIFSSILPFFYPLAAIFRWSIELVIFAALLAPFFDQIIIAMGSGVSGKEIIDLIFDFEFSEAISLLNQVIKG